MKKIEAIIRKTKFEEVKEALHDSGIEFFSFWDARGVGMARESRVYRGIMYDTCSIPHGQNPTVQDRAGARKTGARRRSRDRRSTRKEPTDPDLPLIPQGSHSQLEGL